MGQSSPAPDRQSESKSLRQSQFMELSGNLAHLQYLMARNGLRYPSARAGMRDAEAA